MSEVRGLCPRCIASCQHFGLLEFRKFRDVSAWFACVLSNSGVSWLQLLQRRKRQGSRQGQTPRGPQTLQGVPALQLAAKGFRGFLILFHVPDQDVDFLPQDQARTLCTPCLHYVFRARTPCRKDARLLEPVLETLLVASKASGIRLALELEVLHIPQPDPSQPGSTGLRSRHKFPGVELDALNPKISGPLRAYMRPAHETIRQLSFLRHEPHKSSKSSYLVGTSKKQRSELSCGISRTSKDELRSPSINALQLPLMDCTRTSCILSHSSMSVFTCSRAAPGPMTTGPQHEVERYDASQPEPSKRESLCQARGGAGQRLDPSQTSIPHTFDDATKWEPGFFWVFFVFLGYVCGARVGFWV